MQADFHAAELLPRIPLAARTVMFAGCEDTGLIEAYRRMNPRAQVLAAEPEADAPPGGIDCIVQCGVPGHPGDAASLIRRHAAALSPDGVMVIRALLHQPPVEAAPPFGDASDGMRRVLLAAGLTICDVTPHEPGGDVPDCLIWRVRKEPRQPLILSSTMLDPVGGVSDVRVVHPLSALATDPALRTVVTAAFARRQPHDHAPRIFVLHRPLLAGQAGLNTVRSLAAAGFLVVTEFDDHPDHFDLIRLGGDLTFRGVHALQTSTSAMAEVLRRHNPEIAVFPNAIASLPEVRNFAALPGVTLFFGALNRERDWRPLIPAINAVAARAADRLRFQVVHDRGFFDALKTPHKAFTPTCDYQTYLRLLGGSEISFMPLSDTPFNRAKSDLKFIEAAACRVAPLASTVVYGDSIEDGRTGLLFRDPVEFHARLLRLVALPELARELGDAGRAGIAATRMLAYQVAPRIAWYRSLWARRDALTEALNARLAA
jgi:glycosyltransferase involved in cell wall biosynthesis